MCCRKQRFLESNIFIRTTIKKREPVRLPLLPFLSRRLATLENMPALLLRLSWVAHFWRIEICRRKKEWMNTSILGFEVIGWWCSARSWVSGFRRACSFRNFWKVCQFSRLPSWFVSEWRNLTRYLVYRYIPAYTTVATPVPTYRSSVQSSRSIVVRNSNSPAHYYESTPNMRCSGPQGGKLGSQVGYLSERNS